MSPANAAKIASMITCVLIGVSSAVCASDDVLMRVERLGIDDRNTLIADGVSLVADLGDCFLAVGTTEAVSSAAATHGLGVALLDPSIEGATYALVGLRSGWKQDLLAECGTELWQEEQWALLRSDDGSYRACSDSALFDLRVLDLEPIAPTRPEPRWMTDLAAGRATLETDPLVQEMVDSLTDDLVFDHWQAVVDSATTRYSTSAGCADAAADIFQLFTDLGLSPVYQNHTSGHAPNVVGTIHGIGGLGGEIVVIGHLDDMPSSVPAPGANDNASGSALVTALAEVMACYSFQNTVKLVVVTGEEWGLYGSDYYSSQAVANGDNITAVFNADMVGWEGDGTPATEDLDVNLHSSWPSLGTYLEQVATDYNTGCVVNAFTCNAMTFSDHAPFWADGFPALCAITDNEGYCGHDGNYVGYHTSNDTISNCGSGARAFLGSSARAFLAAAAHMADPVGPLTSTPQNLDAEAAGDNQIALTWDALTGNMTYEVSRIAGGCASGAPAVVIGETTGSSMLDGTASGDLSYGYTVRARDNDGPCVSGASACAEASTTGPCTEPPLFAGLVEAVNLADASCKIQLSWAPVDQLYCGTSASYSVYRSKGPGFTPDMSNRIAEGLTATTWLDQLELDSGEPYYYIVRAVDEFNGGEDRNSIERSATPTGPITVGTWNDDAGDTDTPLLITDSVWSVVGSGGNTAPAAYATGSYQNDVCAELQTPPLLLGSGAQLSFASKYAIENEYDKGIVEISTDSGSSWQRLEVGYPGTAPFTGDECGLPGGDYFTSSDSSYDTYTASLAAYGGLEAVIRWRLSTDGYVTAAGWWVDDISITQVEVPGPCETVTEPRIFIDSFETGNTSAWSEVVN